MGIEEGKRRPGRPKGSPSYKAASLRLLLGRLESEGTLTPRKVLERLQEIALSDAPDRVAAARLLCGYLFGFPTTRVDVKTTHEVGPSAVELLLQIHQSAEHARNLENLQRWRDARALTSGVEQITE